MLALFVLGFFVLPSATIFVIAGLAKAAQAQAVRNAEQHPLVGRSERR